MNRNCNVSMSYLRHILSNFPNAKAYIKGIDEFCNINGTVSFYKFRGKVIVVVDITGLPIAENNCNTIFALHIHDGESCTGNFAEPLANTKGHFDKKLNPHPYHTGDLPPIFSNNGDGWFAFVTDKFSINDICGKTVIIHSNPDDFTTQPAGNSGEKIACGIIKTNSNPKYRQYM